MSTAILDRAAMAAGGGPETGTRSRYVAKKPPWSADHADRPSQGPRSDGQRLGHGRGLDLVAAYDPGFVFLAFAAVLFGPFSPLNPGTRGHDRGRLCPGPNASQPHRATSPSSSAVRA
jgi:hypothetical protein